MCHTVNCFYWFKFATALFAVFDSNSFGRDVNQAGTIAPFGCNSDRFCAADLSRNEECKLTSCRRVDWSRCSSVLETRVSNSSRKSRSAAALARSKTELKQTTSVGAVVIAVKFQRNGGKSQDQPRASPGPSCWIGTIPSPGTYVSSLTRPLTMR